MQDNQKDITAPNAETDMPVEALGDAPSSDDHLQLPPDEEITIPEFGTDERSDQLEALFKKIHVQAMHDVPICNPVIKVEALAYGSFEDMWLGVLVTPWCMNLILLPMEESWEGQRTGDKVKHLLPAGSYEFINGAHEDFGPYRMCSLFSPMYEFADHGSAMATAAVALDAVMTAPSQEDLQREEEAMMGAIMAGAVPEDMRAEPLPSGDEDYSEDQLSQSADHDASEVTDGGETANIDTSPQTGEEVDTSRRSFLRGGAPS